MIFTIEIFMTDAYQIKHYCTILLKPTQSAIEFDKLHYIEQAKVISEKALIIRKHTEEKEESTFTDEVKITSFHGEVYTLVEFTVDEESILNAYSLDLIK